MTTVVCQAVRPVSGGMFDDITTATWRPAFDGTTVTLTFDADLTAAQVAAITARIESRDDADQAARAELQATAQECQDWLEANPDDTTPGALAVRAACSAICYQLRLPTT